MAPDEPPPGSGPESESGTEPRSGYESEPASDAPPVRDVYDRIAGHFAETRTHPWPEVVTFLEDAPPGGVGLDVGCGNGRHLPPLADRVDAVVGLDASRALLAAAGERAAAVAPSLVLGDAGALPVADGGVDLALYVATVHHLRGRRARVESLDELARVLSADGRALVSAWSTEHDRFDAGEGFDTTVDWTLPDGEVVPRFYHVYDPVEFEADIEASGLRVLDAFVSSGNCYATVASPS